MPALRANGGKTKRKNKLIHLHLPVAGAIQHVFDVGDLVVRERGNPIRPLKALSTAEEPQSHQVCTVLGQLPAITLPNDLLQIALIPFLSCYFTSPSFLLFPLAAFTIVIHSFISLSVHSPGSEKVSPSEASSAEISGLIVQDASISQHFQISHHFQ